MTTRPGPACYDGAECTDAPHPDWFHARDWNDVEVALDAGTLVCDHDGDQIHSLDDYDRNEPSMRKVMEIRSSGQHAFYNLQVDQILIQGDPLSEADENEVLASIARAFHNLQD